MKLVRIIFLVVVCARKGGQCFYPRARVGLASKTKLEAKGAGSGGGGFSKNTAESGKLGRQSKKSSNRSKGGSENAQQESSFTRAAKKDPAGAKRLLELYGGDVQKGTVERIKFAQAALAAENPLLAEAMNLHGEKLRWNVQVGGMNLLQQAELVPPEAWHKADIRSARLDELAKSHGITEADIHNAFQRLTWDASADAKAFRATADDDAFLDFTSLGSSSIMQKLDAALEKAAAPVLANGLCGRICEVGSGTGILVKHLERHGVKAAAYLGVDLSAEMTRVAAAAHPGADFQTADWLVFKDAEGFDAILFCMSLHDLPDPTASLSQAASMLRPGGSVVITHPKGAGHVAMQHRKSPEMVPHALPNADELAQVCRSHGMSLDVAPASSGSPEETKYGYLAVLSRGM